MTKAELEYQLDVAVNNARVCGHEMRRVGSGKMHDTYLNQMIDATRRALRFHQLIRAKDGSLTLN